MVKLESCSPTELFLGASHCNYHPNEILRIGSIHVRVPSKMGPVRLQAFKMPPQATGNHAEGEFQKATLVGGLYCDSVAFHFTITNERMEQQHHEQ